MKIKKNNIWKLYILFIFLLTCCEVEKLNTKGAEFELINGIKVKQTIYFENKKYFNPYKKIIYIHTQNVETLNILLNFEKTLFLNYKKLNRLLWETKKIKRKYFNKFKFLVIGYNQIISLNHLIPDKKGLILFIDQKIRSLFKGRVFLKVDPYNLPPNTITNFLKRNYSVEINDIEFLLKWKTLKNEYGFYTYIFSELIKFCNIHYPSFENGINSLTAYYFISNKINIEYLSLGNFSMILLEILMCYNKTKINLSPCIFEDTCHLGIYLCNRSTKYNRTKLKLNNCKYILHKFKHLLVRYRYSIIDENNIKNNNKFKNIFYFFKNKIRQIEDIDSIISNDIYFDCYDILLDGYFGHKNPCVINSLIKKYLFKNIFFDKEKIYQITAKQFIIDYWFCNFYDIPNFQNFKLILEEISKKYEYKCITKYFDLENLKIEKLYDM